MSGIQQMLLGNGGDRISLPFFNPASVVVGIVATASFSIASDGDIDATATNNTIADRGDWIDPKVNMALYEVRATLSSGDPLTTGTMGSFLSLGTTRTWTLAAGPVGSASANVLFEFRLISTGLLVYSRTVVFSAVSS